MMRAGFISNQIGIPPYSPYLSIAIQGLTKIDGFKHHEYIYQTKSKMWILLLNFLTGSHRGMALPYLYVP